MRILLTGATGYLGKHLVRALHRLGHQTISVSRQEPHSLDRSCIGYQRLFDSNKSHISELLGSMPFDAVIHCATCYGRAGESDSEVRTANFDFPQRLFTAIAEVETPAFINTDTILPSAINAYARTKAEFRAWAAQAASSTQTSFINVKFDHMYGPGEDATKFISKITNLCLCNSPIDLTDGQQMRDFIHISDLTEAYMTILAACGDHLLKSEELQIGTGEPTKVRAVVEMIHKFAGSRSELRFGAIPHREHEPMFSSMNAARLRALGWNPKTSLARGISHVVDFERRKIG